MAPVVGIEPTPKVLETLVLPLYYTDMAEGVGFEPTEPITVRTFSKRVP